MSEMRGSDEVRFVAAKEDVVRDKSPFPNAKVKQNYLNLIEKFHKHHNGQLFYPPVSPEYRFKLVADLEWCYKQISLPVFKEMITYHLMWLNVTTAEEVSKIREDRERYFTKRMGEERNRWC